MQGPVSSIPAIKRATPYGLDYFFFFESLSEKNIKKLYHWLLLWSGISFTEVQRQITHSSCQCSDSDCFTVDERMILN